MTKKILAGMILFAFVGAVPLVAPIDASAHWRHGYHHHGYHVYHHHYHYWHPWHHHRHHWHHWR